MAFAPHQLTAQEQWDWIRRGDATSSELTEHYLDRIAARDAELGAFSRVDDAGARARAAAVDAEGQGPAPLSGVPVAEKELVRRAGAPVRWSRLFGARAAEVSD